MSDTPNTWAEYDGIIGQVCAACGMPTETEPCQGHQPDAYAKCVGEEITQ